MIAEVTNPRNFLFYGTSGTGKTTLACSNASEDNLIALLDIDNKASHQMNIRDKVNKGLVDLYPIDNPMLGGGDLDYITNSSTNVVPEGYVHIVKTLNRIIKVETKKYSTIVIDSGTRLVQHLTNMIPPQNGKSQMTQALWLVFYTEMINRITRLGLVPVNWIWIFHERVNIDEITKAKKIGPSIPGQIGTDITSFFNEVYNTRVELVGSKRVYACLTHNNSVYDARTSGDLKDLVKQDMNDIVYQLNNSAEESNEQQVKVNPTSPVVNKDVHIKPAPLNVTKANGGTTGTKAKVTKVTFSTK